LFILFNDLVTKAIEDLTESNELEALLALKPNATDSACSKLDVLKVEDKMPEILQKLILRNEDLDHDKRNLLEELFDETLSRNESARELDVKKLVSLDSRKRYRSSIFQ
jgi:hypothetical protein